VTLVPVPVCAWCHPGLPCTMRRFASAICMYLPVIQKVPVAHHSMRSTTAGKTPMAARLDLLQRRVLRSKTLAAAEVLEFLAVQTQARAERDLGTIISGWEWLAGACTVGDARACLQRKALCVCPVAIASAGAADAPVASPDTDCVLAVRETLTVLGSSSPVVVASLAALMGMCSTFDQALRLFHGPHSPFGDALYPARTTIVTSKLSVADIAGLVRATIASGDVVRAFADFLLAAALLSTPAQRPAVLSSEAGVVALLADALQLHCCGSLTVSTHELATTILSALAECAKAARAAKQEAEKVAADVVPGIEIASAAPTTNAAAEEARRNATVPGDSSRWLLTDLQAGPAAAVVRRFRANMLVRTMHDRVALEIANFILSIIDTHPAPEQEVCQRVYVQVVSTTVQ
jgi:hypothetical protein